MKLKIVSLTLFSIIATLAYIPHVQAAIPGMVLDGSWSMCPNPKTRTCFTFDTVANLTTTHANDVLVLVAQSKFGASNVTSVFDDGGHVWKLRTVIHGNNPIWEYYSIADSPLTADRISVTWNNGQTNPGVAAFAVFGVSGANTHDPWAPRFPVERKNWDGRPVSLSVTGTGDFLIVSTAVNDAPPCYTTTNISPFRNIGEIGWGIYGEVDYFTTHIGRPTIVSFSCDPYSDPMTFLGDDLRGPGM
jgi:hypothetical protein